MDGDILAGEIAVDPLEVGIMHINSVSKKGIRELFHLDRILVLMKLIEIRGIAGD